MTARGCRTKQREARARKRARARRGGYRKPVQVMEGNFYAHGRRVPVVGQRQGAGGGVSDARKSGNRFSVRRHETTNKSRR